MTHICVSKLTIIGPDNGLSPGRRQAIIWTNAGILLIGPLGTNFSENLIGIQTFSFKKMPLKMASAKWRPFCLGLNVLSNINRQSVKLCVFPLKRNENLYELHPSPASLTSVHQLYKSTQPMCLAKLVPTVECRRPPEVRKKHLPCDTCIRLLHATVKSRCSRAYKIEISSNAYVSQTVQEVFTIWDCD